MFFLKQHQIGFNGRYLSLAVGYLSFLNFRVNKISELERPIFKSSEIFFFGSNTNRKGFWALI